VIDPKNSKILADIPVFEISNLSVIGNVQVTTQALHLLMEEGIDVSYFSFSGEQIGQVVSASSKNVFLRMGQYERYMNIGYRLEVARGIVRAKVKNQITVIRYFNWDEAGYDYHQDVRQMETQVDTLPLKNTSNAIMGVEGICSAAYFRVFSHFFKCDFVFSGRNRRPPKDPINIILSLAYTLLSKEVSAALESESFETYLGFLHGIRYGRKSLALDIMEPFRQPVADRLTVYLFNRSILNHFDFETIDDTVKLTEGGFEKFCREYEKWMQRPVYKGEPRSFRELIHDNVAELKRAIKEERDFRPFEWRRDRTFLHAR